NADHFTLSCLPLIHLLYLLCVTTTIEFYVASCNGTGPRPHLGISVRLQLLCPNTNPRTPPLIMQENRQHQTLLKTGNQLLYFHTNTRYIHRAGKYNQEQETHPQALPAGGRAAGNTPHQTKTQNNGMQHMAVNNGPTTWQ
ncbi:unnamed protein product, partial [Staurois parvus]